MNFGKMLKERKILKTQKKIFEDFEYAEFFDFDFDLGSKLPVFFYNGHMYELHGNILPALSPEILTFCTERLSLEAKNKIKTNLKHFKQMCEIIRDADLEVFSKEKWDAEILKCLEILSNKKTNESETGPQQQTM